MTPDITRSLSEKAKKQQIKWPFQNMVIKIMINIMMVSIMIKIMTPDITRSSSEETEKISGAQCLKRQKKKQQRNVAFSKHRDKDNDGIDNDKDNETADIMVKEIMKKIMIVSMMISNNTADITRSLSEKTGKISSAPRARRQKKSNKEI